MDQKFATTHAPIEYAEDGSVLSVPNPVPPDDGSWLFVSVIVHDRHLFWTWTQYAALQMLTYPADPRESTPEQLELPLERNPIE